MVEWILSMWRFSHKFKVTGYDYQHVDSCNDSGVGAWVGCGVYYTFEGGLNIGCDIRYSTAMMSCNELQNGKYDAGGTHCGLIVGYQF